MFVMFMKQFNFDSSLPVSPITMALFISHMHSNKYAASTIATYVSAVGYIHKLYNLQDPANSFLVRKAIVGARKESHLGDVRLPVTLPILHKLVGALQFCAGSAYREIMFTSMFLLAVAAFLRVGEITRSNQNDTNILQFQDVTCAGAAGDVRLTFRAYKHSKGKPHSLVIARAASHCPVEALERYIEQRGMQAGFLYIWPVGNPVTRDEFCKVLHNALAFCGLDPKVYKSHSFRIGAACWAASMGYSDTQIREMGRWKSDAFKRYIRL